MIKNKTVENIVYTAMFISLGVVLPFITAYVPNLGKMLLPMHIPVLLCGIICGAKYGFFCGSILPIFRSLLLAAPPLYPDAIVMTFELAAYGTAIGIMYRRSKLRQPLKIYVCLILSMLLGRLVWAAARTVLRGIGSIDFSFKLFVSMGFIKAFPGIVLQLILIPATVLLYEKSIGRHNETHKTNL